MDNETAHAIGHAWREVRAGGLLLAPVFLLGLVALCLLAVVAIVFVGPLAVLRLIDLDD